MVQDIQNDAKIPVKNNLIGPSVSGTWTPEDVWNTGYISDFAAMLYALAVEQCVTLYNLSLFCSNQRLQLSRK